MILTTSATSHSERETPPLSNTNTDQPQAPAHITLHTTPEQEEKKL